MKEKIKQFVVTKGWLMVLTGITTFFLTTFAFWVAMAVLFPFLFFRLSFILNGRE